MLRRDLLIVALFALALVPRRLLIAFRPASLEFWEYETLAVNIASGTGYVINRFGHNVLAFGDGNLYSLLAGALYAAVGHHPLVLAGVQAMFASLAVPVPPSKPPAEVSAACAVSLRTLIVFLVLFGAGLCEVVGLPHAPDPPIGVPDPSSLEAMLRSSRPPLDGAVYVVGMLGWSVWAWLVLSLLLQVCVGIAEHVAGSAAGVRQARGIADLLSAPLVRKAVQTSLAGGLVARVALAGVPAAAAAPPEQAAFSVNFSLRGDVSPPPGRREVAPTRRSHQSVRTGGRVVSRRSPGPP
jgi:hypothetical protein